MSLPYINLWIFCLTLLILFPSCGNTRKVTVASVPPANVPVEQMTGFFEETGFIPGHLLKWEDDPSLSGDLMVVVDKKKQMMFVYRGVRRIAYSPISSGESSGMTPTGYFLISDKDEDHQSYYGSFVNADGEMRNGDIRKDSPERGECFKPAKMPYFLRVSGAVGLHEGYLPGRPSSHGCVRLPQMIAKNLFEVASIGTRVVIVDGNWNIHDLQNQPDEIFKSVPKSPPSQRKAKPDPDEKNDGDARMLSGEVADTGLSIEKSKV